MLTNLAYESIAFEHNVYRSRWGFHHLLKLQAPTKITCFNWLAIQDDIMTRDNYKRLGGMVLTCFPRCLQAVESVDQQLVTCNTSQRIWEEVTYMLSVVNWPMCIVDTKADSSQNVIISCFEATNIVNVSCMHSTGNYLLGYFCMR